MAKTDKITKNLLSKLIPAPLTLGVEVSEYSIKMVLLKQESPDSASVLDYAIIPLVAKVVSTKLSPLSVIKNILKEKKLFTARQAKLAVSGPELDCKRVTLPFMPKKEIAQALRLEAKDRFLFNIEEAVLGYEVVEEVTAKDGTRRMEVIASAAKSAIIDERLSFFEDSRVVPSVVIPAAYCLYNLYRLGKEWESAEQVALIDIGASTTTVVIIKEGKIRFIRQLGCAGKDFTKAMTQTLVSDKGKVELSPEEAEELKIQSGFPDESAQLIKEGIFAQQVSSMLRPVVEKLATEIKRSFEYYTSQFDEGRVNKVIVTGGSSKLKNINVQFSHQLKDVYPQFSQTLSIPIESLEIPEGLKTNLISEREDSFKKDFPLLAVAVGAALNNPQGINLIPPSYQAQKIKRIKRISIRIIFIVISLILLTFYLFNSAQEKLLQNLLAAKQPQWQKLLEIQKLHSSIVQKNTIIEHTLKNQVPLYYVFKALSNLIPKGVYLESLSIKDKANRLEMVGVILETTDSAETTLANFIKVLEDSPFFNNVNLISSQDTEKLGRGALEFNISCNLNKHASYGTK